MYYTKSLHRKLRQAIRKIRKMVHSPNCRYPHACPASHPSCSKLLNDRTAIWWTISEAMDTMCDCMGQYQQKRSVTRIETCRHILSHHATKEEQDWLYSMYARILSEASKQIHEQNRKRQDYRNSFTISA